MQKTPPAAGSPPLSSPQTLQAQDKFISSKKETTIQGRLALKTIRQLQTDRPPPL